MPTNITGVINDINSNISDIADKLDSNDDEDKDNLKGLPKLLQRDEEYDSLDNGDCSDSDNENKDDQGNGPPLEDVGEEVTNEQDDNEGGSTLPPSPGRGHWKQIQTTCFIPEKRGK